MEADDVGPRVGEARCCEAILHVVRVDRREGVVRVRHAYLFEVQGVLSHEDAPGAQDPVQFGEQPILILGRRHVVQDREAPCRGESTVGQSGVSRIGDDDVDVRSGQAILQGCAQRRVDLHGSHLPYPLTEDVGGEARTRTDLEDVIAQIACGLYPGQ